MSPSTSVHDLKSLILSFHSIITIETVEEERVRHLLQSVANQTRMPLFEWSVTKGLTKSDASNHANRMTVTPLSAIQHIGGLSIEGIFFLKDFSRHLDDPALVRELREVAHRFAHTRSALILTAATMTLPPDIEPHNVQVTLQLPDAQELEKTLQHIATSLGKMSHWDMHLTLSDRENLLRNLQGLTLHQARQAIAQAIVEDGKLTSRAIQMVLEKKVKMIKEGGLLEYYPQEDNHFELGGFANLKQWLTRAAVGFTQEAQALNLSPPRGILLVGIQGCGKSLAAKVIAREWKMPLLKFDMGRLYDKFIGETEKNFHKAITLAESIAPAILWLDEIEKGLGSVGGGTGDGGVSRRIFGSFLTWLQEKKQEIFVVATANDLSSLPPELLRKGRFDEIFFVDLPDEKERHAILTIHLTLRKQDPTQFDLPLIVSTTQGFSGAEIEQAIIAALYRALHKKTPLDTNLLLEEIQLTVPLSVSRKEDVQNLQTHARERFVPVR